MYMYIYVYIYIYTYIYIFVIICISRYFLQPSKQVSEKNKYLKNRKSRHGNETFSCQSLGVQTP